jgi:hypothetical protein
MAWFLSTLLLPQLEESKKAVQLLSVDHGSTSHQKRPRHDMLWSDTEKHVLLAVSILKKAMNVKGSNL